MEIQDCPFDNAIARQDRQTIWNISNVIGYTREQWIKHLDIGVEISRCFCKYFFEYQDDYVIDEDIAALCEEYLNETIDSSNTTNLTTSWPCSSETPPSVHVLTVLYSIIMPLAAIGNICVLSVVIFNKNFRGNATYLISSLAVADLLMTSFCMPFNLMQIRGTCYGMFWDFEDAWCKIIPYMQTFAVVANVFTLLAMSIERYIVIMHPLKTKSLQTAKIAAVLLVTIWTEAALFAIPCAVWYEVKTQQCRLKDDYLNENMKIYRSAIFIFIFIIPLIFSSGLYAGVAHKLWARNVIGIQSSHFEQLRVKTTRRVILMLVVVQILFFITWAPTMTFELMLLFEWIAEEDDDPQRLLTMRYFFQWLAMCNSCLNPIVYTFMHEKFRKNVFCQQKRRARVAPNPAIAVLGHTSQSSTSHVKKSSTRLTDTRTPDKSQTTDVQLNN